MFVRCGLYKLNPTLFVRECISLVYREQSWIKLKEGFKLLNFYRKEAGQEHPAANVDHFLWKTGVTGGHPGSEKREENFSRDVGQQVGMRWMPS